jgi:endonuclease G
MKKNKIGSIIHKIFFSLFLLIAFSFVSNAQDIIKLEYKYYTSWFSTSEHIPLVVEYTLTKNMLTCKESTERTDKFKADPNHKDITNLSKDYRNSGYDRGHNMNADDNKCNDEGMEQCFYFSNMTPQPHSFNAGKWEEVENLERADAMQFNKVIVTCGSVGVLEKIGPDNVVVPKLMWKVIYIPSTKVYQCYIFPDTDDVSKDLVKYAVKRKQVENIASVTFNKGVVALEEE